MDSIQNMDSVCLRQIIPVEIWKIVTETLLEASPADLESLANSSFFYQNLLAPFRTIFLFERVIEIVTLTVLENMGPKGVPIQDLIKCRQVCSQWNSAIDKLVRKNLQITVRNPNGKTSRENIRWLMGNQFDDRYDIESVHRFIDHFMETHPGSIGRSPFIVPHLYIFNSAKVEPQNLYLEDLDALVISYEIYIQHLTIDVLANLTFFNNLSRLRSWIQCMPNLAKLTIYCTKNWNSNNILEYDENDQGFKLEHLECLDTMNLPSSVFNLLIRQNSHVSTLIMKSCKDDYDFFRFSLPNLKKLEMGYCSSQISIKLGFPEVDWALESLTLVVGNELDAGCAPILKLIQNKFSKTLVYLELGLNATDVKVEGPVWKAFKTCRLDLPKLKKIKLDVCDNLTCLDFLLPMRNNLEEISVNGGCVFPLSYRSWYARELAVQFIGFEGNMLESNVWEVFTKFKKFEVEHRWDRVLGYQYWLYSREEWEQYRMRNFN